MYYPTTAFDSMGAQQLPIDRENVACKVDFYNQPIYEGDNIIEFKNGDIIQIGAFREYINDLPDSELIEFMDGREKEAKA